MPPPIKLCPESSELALLDPAHLLNIFHECISYLPIAISVPDSLSQALPQVYEGSLNSDLEL